MKFSFFYSILAFTFFSCSSTPPSLPDAVTQVPLGPIQVKADKELFGLRVDLVRSDPKSDPAVNAAKAQDPSSMSAVDPSVYALTGMDLGNGLFLDTSKNLGVDLLRLYGINPPFTINETTTGPFPRHMEFSFKGSTFYRTGDADDSPYRQVTVGSDQIDVADGSGNLLASVYSGSDGLVFNPSGFHLTNKIALKQVSPNRVELPVLLGTSVFSAQNDDEADLTSRYHLQRSGNVLTITVGGYMVGNGGSFRYVLTKDGCWFSDPQGNAHEVKKQGDSITVWKNGNLERTYQIIPTKGTGAR